MEVLVDNVLLASNSPFPLYSVVQCLRTWPPGVLLFPSLARAHDSLFMAWIQEETYH